MLIWGLGFYNIMVLSSPSSTIFSVVISQLIVKRLSVIVS